MSDEASLSYEDPPLRGAYDWSAIAVDLEKHPMKWAKVFDLDRQSLAVAIRVRGITALHPDKGFEVRTRNNTKPEDGPRTCSMWLRYNPERDTRIQGKVT